MLTPHAYVVEYRVADACFPPSCEVSGGKTFGRVGDQPAGGYVAFGNDKDELFAKRGVAIEPSRSLSFTLPAVLPGSVFDASFASASPQGGPFRAVIEIRSGDTVVAKHEVDGKSETYVRRAEVAELGREERYFRHVREALPASAARTTIVLRNEGPNPLGVGAPLVLRRVEGRQPRQAVLVFFDAVPSPVFAELYRGADPGARWISEWVKRGTLFSEAVSPGQLTGSFVRRFFRADYYRLEGDPSLAGQGFDENPPERAPGPVARLAEQGFVTSALGSNLYLSPLLSRVGFDSDYNVESTIDLQIHPEALARRFADEMEIHGEDDALFVVWFANTHMPWREGKGDAAPLRLADSEELDMQVLEPIWKNLLDSVDSFRKMVKSAEPHRAARTWVVGTDHGHTFTLASRARPWRLTGEAVDGGHMHCCLATAQEARTFLALVDETGDHGAGAVGEPISTLTVWGEIERRFGVNLDLPETSAFELPGRHAKFDDGILVSVGNSGSLFGMHDGFSYHSYEPSRNVAAAWELGPNMSRLVFGSPDPTGGIPSEELYDVAGDAREKTNIASERFDVLIDMRRRMADWLAEYGDRPERERSEYRLTFAEPIGLSLRAPRSFYLQIDDKLMTLAPLSVSASAASIRLRDGEFPLGVVDFGGDVVRRKLLVRCGASGLPLAELDEKHPRLNLALARTNCPGGFATNHPKLAPGEAFFSADVVQRRNPSPGGPSGVAVPELRRALVRWGYVRDK